MKYRVFDRFELDIFNEERLPEIILNFKLYTPFYDSAIKIYMNDTHEIIAELDDGSFISYHNPTKTFRHIPNPREMMSEEECKIEFGIRLRKIMEDKYITQEELSSLTSIPQYLISKYINGKTSPSLYNLDKIARALNCSVDDFRCSF